MRTLSVLLSLFLVTGCATTGPSQFVSDPGDGIKWKQLVKAGVSEDAKFGFFTSQVTEQGKSNFFTQDTEKITWWCQVAPFAFMLPARFQARWYQPDGNLFWEEEFSYASDIATLLYKTSIPVKGAPAQNFLGMWRIEVFYKDKLIDRRKFYITGSGPNGAVTALGSLPSSLGSAVAFSAANSESLTLPESLPENSANAQIKERYEKARIYIKNKMYPEAIENLQSVLKDEPAQTEAHLALATIFFRQTKWDDCLKELDYVVQNPQYRDRAMNIRGMVLEMKQAPENARS